MSLAQYQQIEHREKIDINYLLAPFDDLTE
jgi:hypothetical protein